MLSSTFLKTLYTRRSTMLWWSLAIAALVVFTMIFYPSLKSFGESVKQLPESQQAFVGDPESFTSVAGYTDVQIITQMSTMFIILAVLVFTGLLAGEEGDGTLQTLLVQPISRGRAYIEKLLGAMVVLWAAVFSMLVGIEIGLLLIHEHLGIIRLLEAGFAVWLLALLFGALGYSLGAILGRRGIAGGLAGVLAFASVLVTTLSKTVDKLKPAEKFSPFHYFNEPGILKHGANWKDFAFLGSISLVMLVIGYVAFLRRDITQK